MKLRRHDTEVFSLSFLDCICCGFGAIILLLVMTDFDQPVIIERTRVAMDGQLARLQQELHEIRGETDQLNRELQGRIADLERRRARLARVSGDLTQVRGEFAATRGDAAVSNIVETELVSAYQELTAEMERLLRQPAPRRAAADSPVGGIPVDSEYVVFVIDTSNSMVSFHWDATLDILKEILDIHPQVKGLQVMNDQGRQLIAGAPGRWLTDGADTRRRIQDRMRDWRPYSESNPVPGIVQALRSFRAPGQRISVYVIGDEFTGESMQVAVDQVEAVNRADPRVPRARIHAIGFPEGPGYPPFTNIRFSSLMRSLAARNEGTFVGLTNEKPCRRFVEVLGTRRCLGD
jgi:hypothetical protein